MSKLFSLILDNNQSPLLIIAISSTHIVALLQGIVVQLYANQVFVDRGRSVTKEMQGIGLIYS